MSDNENGVRNKALEHGMGDGSNSELSKCEGHHLK